MGEKRRELIFPLIGLLSKKGHQTKKSVLTPPITFITTLSPFFVPFKFGYLFRPIYFMMLTLFWVLSNTI